jgi:Trp operon repressor
MKNTAPSTLNFQYTALASDPAWLDLIEMEENRIQSNKDNFFNDLEMKEDEREILRLKIAFNQELINGMKVRINTMSVKEQK